MQLRFVHDPYSAAAYRLVVCAAPQPARPPARVAVAAPTPQNSQGTMFPHLPRPTTPQLQLQQHSVLPPLPAFRPLFSLSTLTCPALSPTLPAEADQPHPHSPSPYSHQRSDVPAAFLPLPRPAPRCPEMYCVGDHTFRAAPAANPPPLPTVCKTTSTARTGTQFGIGRVAGGVAPSPLPLPCAHQKKWKRLRTKKGMDHMLCGHCGAKWRVPHALGTPYSPAPSRSQGSRS
eukprot:RCo001108